MAKKKTVKKKAVKKKATAKKVVKKTGNSSVTSSSGSVRRFELVDEKSSKFWEVSHFRSVFTVRYGRIGTEGQTKDKDQGSADKTATEVEKLIRARRWGCVRKRSNVLRESPAFDTPINLRRWIKLL